MSPQRTRFLPYLLLILIFPFFISTCSRDTSGQNDTRQLLVKEWWDGYLNPELTDFIQNSKTLEEKAHAYCDNPTPESKSAAQQAWIAAFKNLKRQEIFSFGPYKRPPVRSFRDLLDTWPVKTSIIETYIRNIEPGLTLEQFSHAPTIVVGLPAVEYLLWDSTPIDDSPNRCILLRMATKHIILTVERLKKAWDPNQPDGFYNQLLNPGPNSEYPTEVAVLSELVNRLWYPISTIRRDRFGRPAGTNIRGGAVQPLLAEAYYSGNGVFATKTIIQGIKDLYVGRSDAPISLQKITQRANSELDTKMIADFQNVDNALNAISDPLQDAVKNQKNDVINSINIMGDLQRTISVDLISALGLSLGLQDSDGD